MTFPKDFLWGGATSSVQFEGGWNEGGRKDSTIDHLTVGSRTKPRVFTEEIIADYCYPSHKGSDFFHRYKEDIKMMADLGLNMFRLSISWTRIYPDGDNEKPNRAGLDFYHDVFKELKKYNIEPLVTIYHCDMPFNISKKYDGWYGRDTIDLYLKYCKAIFEEYKGEVKYWLTFNETNASLLKGSAFMCCGIYNIQSKDLGSGIVDEKDRIDDDTIDLVKQYQSVHHMFVASAKAVKLAHEINPNYQVGCMIAAICQYPMTCNPDDVVLSCMERQKMFYYCPDVQVRGYYPNYVKRLFKEMNIIIKMEDEDEEILKNGKVDFFSFSYYSTGCVSTRKDSEKTGGNLVFGAANPYLKSSDWGWQIDPQGLRYILNEIYDRYQLPIMLVENGLGQNDILEADHRVHDPYRIEYFKEHIKAMGDAIDDGVDLIAYAPWGIIDLPAASTGEMAKRYGVIYVEADDNGNGTYERYKKDSYYWYQKVIASGGNDLD